MIETANTILSRFRNIDDVEFEHVAYRTRVPHVAPLAYLTVVFKPAPASVRLARTRDPLLPSALSRLFEEVNGANLFSDALIIYGFRPDHYLLERKDWLRNALPHDLVEVNREYERDLTSRNMVCFADYVYDRSLVLLDRLSERVTCLVGDDFNHVRTSWESVDEWLTAEVARLATLFDEDGRLLLGEQATLPSRTREPSS